MPRTYYHATDAVFDRFDPSRQGAKGASNGHLGVWVSCGRAGCEAFGDVLMTLSLPDARPFAMTVEELRGLHDETRGMTEAAAAGFYRGRAEALMAEGYDVIDVVEKDGEVVHSVILDLSAVQIVGHERLEREAPSAWGR